MRRSETAPTPEVRSPAGWSALAGNKLVRVRAAAAASPHAAAHGVELPAGDPSVTVKRAAAARADLVADVLRGLVGDPDLRVRQALVGNAACTTAAVVDWPRQRPLVWSERVRYVAIDMCTVFKAAVHEALPAAGSPSSIGVGEAAK